MHVIRVFSELLMPSVWCE